MCLNRDWHRTGVFFYGLGFRYDRIYNQLPGAAPLTPSSFERYSIGTNESLHSTGITFNILYDDRRNSVNPRKGGYASAVVRSNPALFGNSLIWSGLYLDARKYVSLSSSKRRILAFWAMYWGSFGSVPYLLLPATSTDFYGQTGRGYTFARFRGREMLYVESEYRFDISSSGLFGGVFFCNVQSFSEPDTEKFEKFLPATGAGIRIKLNKKSNTNFGLDFTYGLDGFAFNALLGEAF
jgi:outer membrane protein assembly factor BamA